MFPFGAIAHTKLAVSQKLKHSSKLAHFGEIWQPYCYNSVILVIDKCHEPWYYFVAELKHLFYMKIQLYSAPPPVFRDSLKKINKIGSGPHPHLVNSNRVVKFDNQLALDQIDTKWENLGLHKRITH